MSVTSTSASIATMAPAEVIDSKLARDKFCLARSIIRPDASPDDLERDYQRERSNARKIIAASADLQAATPMSVLVAFVDLGTSGLTLEPRAQAQAYLVARGVKTSQLDTRTGKPVYEKQCNLIISGYGEMAQRQYFGQIRHADNPVIVYAGDDFRFSLRSGVKTIDYTLNIDHDVTKPIACFMAITRADGSLDYAVMTPSDWLRLQKYSEEQNHGRGNALYTSGEGARIDEGFLIAKCIKHAFKSYPRVMRGTRATIYETEQTPEPETIDASSLYIDLDNDSEPETVTGSEQTSEPASRPVVDLDRELESDEAFE